MKKEEFITHMSMLQTAFVIIDEVKDFSHIENLDKIALALDAYNTALANLPYGALTRKQRLKRQQYANENFKQKVKELEASLKALNPEVTHEESQEAQPPITPVTPVTPPQADASGDEHAEPHHESQEAQPPVTVLTPPQDVSSSFFLQVLLDWKFQVFCTALLLACTGGLAVSAFGIGAIAAVTVVPDVAFKAGAAVGLAGLAMSAVGYFFKPAPKAYDANDELAKTNEPRA